MVYDRYELLRRPNLRSSFSRDVYASTLRDEFRSLRTRRKASRANVLSPITPPRPLGQKDIPLIVAVRNEQGRLEPFFEHYRSLGITRFLAIDDRSSDNTRDFLTRQPDVDLYSSALRYGEARGGNTWRYAFVRRYGFGRWYVMVDADEYLVYDGMCKNPLPRLIRWLEARKLYRLLAPMIDFYPNRPVREVSFDPSRPPWESVDHFDVSGYRIVANERGAQIFGGPRRRKFGFDLTLQKYPLIFCDGLTAFQRSIHYPLPYFRNFMRVFGALLHFKFFADFENRVIEMIEDAQHWNNAADYKNYYDHISKEGDLDFADAHSMKYRDSEQLVSLGLLEAIEW